MARWYELHPDNPQTRTVKQVTNLLQDGQLVAYPTDSGYCLGALVSAREAAERIKTIRRLKDKHHFTLVCADFAQLGPLVKLDNTAFRAIKAATPGPYTFILKATSEVPRRLAHPKKKTVGVRITDHPVARAILEELGEPLLSSTLILPGETEPLSEGWQIAERLDHELDAIVDAGPVPSQPTTVVDWSEGSPEIIRVGAGDPDRF